MSLFKTFLSAASSNHMKYKRSNSIHDFLLLTITAVNIKIVISTNYNLLFSKPYSLYPPIYYRHLYEIHIF